MSALMISILPLSLVAVLWFLQQATGIRRLKEEKQALRCSKACLRLMLEIQQHRGMANAFLSGDSAFREKLRAAQERIDERIAAVRTAGAILQQDPATAVQWRNFRADWQDLCEQTLQLSLQESFRRHSLLVGRILALQRRIADLSGMTVDPNPQRYGLLDTLIAKLPSVLEHVAQARGLGTGIAARGRMTMAERMELVALATIIQAALTSLRGALPAAAGQKKFAGWDGKGADDLRAIDEFLRFMQQALIDSATIRLNPEEYFAAGTRAIDAGRSCCENIEKKLAALFDQRIAVYSRQVRVLAAGAAAVVSALYVNYPG